MRLCGLRQGEHRANRRSLQPAGIEQRERNHAAFQRRLSPVKTAGFRDGQWLDRAGSPLTSAAKMTEKLRRPNYGTLEIDLTVNDPEAYTQPWTIALKHSLLLNTELLDYICLENEKDAGHLIGK